ncbi:MAG: sigma-54-dependent transcriptional regulator [Desulfatiglandales bacterium]
MDRILVVDDDQNILKVIKMRLEAEAYEVEAASRADEAVEAAKTKAFDVALLDLKLSGRDGIGLMEELHQINPDMPVLILTAYGTIQSAVEAMRKGAYSYLTKPFNYQDLLLQLKNCLEKSNLTKEVKRLRNLVKTHYGFENIIARSEKMKRVLEKVAQAAQSDSSVYIEGESGTGKELVANTLHLVSSRKDAPFVAINCAAIPETLLESELFGHERGAFTGAVNGKKGLFSQAHKGTFFLDEISEMPLAMQAKLLRVLQEKEFYPLGSRKTVKVDVRFIASSNRNLEEVVAEGNFREDLFYRIHVIPIKIPPLRERKEDIPLLAKHFLRKYSQKSRNDIQGISPSAVQKLVRYSWPGNVRELQNTIECAVAMSHHDTITEDLILQTQNLEKGRIRLLKDAREDFEKDYLVQLIELTQGNVSKAAKLSGKYRADLYDLLRKHDLDPADFRAEKGKPHR